MKLIKNSQKFQWIGEGVPDQKNKKKNYHDYEAFTLGDLIIGIGDFVLVRNDDVLDPEDFMSCYVAQVKKLFDTGDEFDPYRAQVQWFSRVLELPTNTIKLFNSVAHELEIVMDKRSSWHNIIDAETIFKKCEVLFLPITCDFESTLSEYKDQSELSAPIFVCRYVFTGTSLIEVKDQQKVNFARASLSRRNSSINGLISPNKRTTNGNIQYEKSNLPNKAHEKYCAISIGSPSKIPKVVIKKIDDKILDSKNKNIRIFVADPNIKGIEEVTDIFLNKLKLEKEQDNGLDNKPIIHSFTSNSNNKFEKSISTENTKFMDYDSNIECDISKTPQRTYNDKYSVNLNTRFCKSVFSYNTRNSPKKNLFSNSEIVDSSPAKRQKIIMLNDLKLAPSKPKISNFSIVDNDMLKPRQGKINQKEQESDVDENSKFKTKENKINGNSDCSDIETYPLSKSSRTRKSSRVSTTSSTSKSTKVTTADTQSSSKLDNSDVFSTPKKKAKFIDELDEFRLTRSGRRVKAVNYTEQKNERSIIPTTTPTKKWKFVCSNLPDDSDSDNFDASAHSSDDDSLSDSSLLDETPSKTKQSIKKKTTSKKSRNTTFISRKSIVNLSIPERKTPLRAPKNALEESRQRLHVSSVPSSLPCRDEEYSDIYSFVKGCLCAQTGGCMYISGVPGTGKTATVHEVMHNLEEEKESGEIPIFTFVEVNGMWMTDPYQCYVQIFKALTGKSIAPQQAADLLEKRFTERGPRKDAVVLLVDELDRLWTRKQTVMYNIFDWPTKKNSKLIVLAIANTMDLPERMMMNRISSRLGLTRKFFQPYTFKQLQEIIMSRIQELKVFDPDAVQLVARKVAAVSGDARRALDICRFATETVKVGQTVKRGQKEKVLVGMEHVDKALQQMFSSPVISAIKSSSKITKLFFQCILSEFTRSGLEETTLLKVHKQVISCCRFEGLNPPNSTEISRICADLASSHLILIDNFKNDLYMKIRLNISSDDVTYALTLK